MLPPAPGRLSAISATPSSFDISSAMSQVRKSHEPPGGKPTTRRIGLAGNACAKAEPQKSQISRTRNMRAPPRPVRRYLAPGRMTPGADPRGATSAGALLVAPAEEGTGVALVLAPGEALVLTSGE